LQNLWEVCLRFNSIYEPNFKQQCSKALISLKSRNAIVAESSSKKLLKCTIEALKILSDRCLKKSWCTKRIDSSNEVNPTNLKAQDTLMRDKKYFGDSLQRAARKMVERLLIVLVKPAYGSWTGKCPCGSSNGLLIIRKSCCWYWFIGTTFDKRDSLLILSNQWIVESSF